MSSHREAPEISQDPVADSTDLYAFVSPDHPDHVTLIANYVPLQAPDGGPNFYEFGDDVLYAINIDNDNDGDVDISYQFQFTSQITNPNTFLYNTGPITGLKSASWNRRQTYTVTRVDKSGSHVLATGVPCPPCNIGPLSTPNYVSLANAAITELDDGMKVFAGQRAEGFYVDLGAIFDLGDLRPFEQDHNTFGLANTGLGKMAQGVNSTAGVNVHSIAIQVEINELTASGKHPAGVTDPLATIGVWTTASRQKARIFESTPGANVNSGPFVQVSRLGNPLVNEVLIPMASKDFWNAQSPYRRQPVRLLCLGPRVGRAAPRPVSRGLPEPGGLQCHQDPPGRPPGHSDDRHPDGRGPRVPELHRHHPVGHAAPQHGHSRLHGTLQSGPDRWRPGRLSQRTSCVRRRGHHRAPGHRRGHAAAGRPGVQA